MIFLFRRTILVWIAILLAGRGGLAQINPDEKETVRVNVTLNTDGSRTTYQFDQPHHVATATTTSADGKVLNKIRYEIDDNGRFINGIILGPDEKFLFKSIYKYNPSGRLDQEAHLTKDDQVINTMIYHYDAAGRQTGYTVVDASGKVLGQTIPKPTASPKTRKSGR
jgi:hypothetical protein